MHQPDLFTAQELTPTRQPDELPATLEERFQAFHELNPHVYRHLRRLALDLARRDRRMGIGGLFEVLRWQYAIVTTGDPFRLNNNYRAFYARLLMDSEPELEGFFDTRRQPALEA